MVRALNSVTATEDEQAELQRRIHLLGMFSGLGCESTSDVLSLLMLLLASAHRVLLG